MKKNALIPYLLIMVLGLGLVVALSFIGLADMKKNKAESVGGSEDSAAAATPEEIYTSSCMSCHGTEYEGGMGPELKNVEERLSEEEIKDVLKNGRGAMPGDLVPEEVLDDMTEWLITLE